MSTGGKSRGKRVEKLQIMVADEEIASIDNWRFAHRAPNRSAAVRSLVLLGLKYAENYPDEARARLIDAPD